MGNSTEQKFWLKMTWLTKENGVTKGTIMGQPCLRQDGRFFAMVDRKSGNAIFKLPVEQVTQLIEKGEAKPCAPAGKIFREWASFPMLEGEHWNEIVTASRAFVRSDSGSKSAKKKARSVKRGIEKRRRKRINPSMQKP